MDRDLTLVLTGDVMLGRIVNEVIVRSGYAYPWGNLLPVMRQADLRLINLECALTDREERWSGDPHKPFFFRSDSATTESLRIAGIDFATIANNHIGDFGMDGLLDTVGHLQRAGIAFAGAGSNQESAAAPAILEAGGMRVGIVAFADHPVEWAAGPDSPGLNLCRPASDEHQDFLPVAEALKRVADRADLVVSTAHWGPNMRDRPTKQFRSFARRVIDAGADIFWGHSAHVVQGIEIYRGKPILYDTGDFIDDYIVDPYLRNDLSALFLVRVGDRRPTAVELIPVRIDRAQVNLATGADRRWFARRISELSREMGTKLEDDGHRLIVRIE